MQRVAQLVKAGIPFQFDGQAINIAQADTSNPEVEKLINFTLDILKPWGAMVTNKIREPKVVVVTGVRSSGTCKEISRVLESKGWRIYMHGMEAIYFGQDGVSVRLDMEDRSKAFSLHVG